MLSQFICKPTRSFFVAAAVVMMGASVAQTESNKSQVQVGSVKPAEWTGNLRPALGSHSAAITVVFFIDYQCPSCRTADPLIRQAVSKRSDVALIYREFPLANHPLAKPAAIVAENARDRGTFDLAHKRLMEGQTVTEGAIKDAAHVAGVSTNETARATERIESDRSLEKLVHLAYVPSFIVIENGKSTLMNKVQILDYLK
jgi:protein-disulfide isomerase